MTPEAWTFITPSEATTFATVTSLFLVLGIMWVRYMIYWDARKRVSVLALSLTPDELRHLLRKFVDPKGKRDSKPYTMGLLDGAFELGIITAAEHAELLATFRSRS